MNRYIVKSCDLTGDIKDFPIELVQWMVDQQLEQGNKPDVGVFQEVRYRNKGNGGFNWSECDWGGDEDDCSDIITRKNFDLFFQHFPKAESQPTPIMDKHFCLPELKAVEMEVSMNGIDWIKCDVYGVYKNMYATTYDGLWRFCRPIQQHVKLTRAEIAEKLGVSKDFILED